MKRIITLTIALLVAAWSIARAQQYPDEYLGLPGDNLNLYAVMDLFQESETLEGFERSLNDENSKINNLDLNGDNLVDYLMVVDYTDGDLHTIVLRAALDRDETQDVAVFTVQRFNDGAVQIQLVGDEALYGKNYIVEPIYADNLNETPNPGYIGNSGSRANVAVVRTTTYEVAAWPVVRYIYLPTYVTWRSYWHRGYYPSYWSPWRPHYWHYYYGYHYNLHRHYYAHYRTWHRHRSSRYNDFYYDRKRSYSPRVSARIKRGHYKTTYSRPDLRRAGEALYTRTNTEQNTRNRNTTSVSRSRKSGSGTIERSSERTRSGAVRQPATTVTRRSARSASVDQGATTTRKSATVTNKRPAKSSSVRQRAGTTRSPSAKVSREATTRPARSSGNSTVRQRVNTTPKSARVTNSRPAKSSSVRQSTGNTRRSPVNVSRKSVSKTQAAPKVSTKRSSSGQSRSAVSRGSSGSRSRSSATKNRSTRSSSGRSLGRR